MAFDIEHSAFGIWHWALGIWHGMRRLAVDLGAWPHCARRRVATLCAPTGCHIVRADGVPRSAERRSRAAAVPTVRSEHCGYGPNRPAVWRSGTKDRASRTMYGGAHEARLLRCAPQTVAPNAGGLAQSWDWPSPQCSMLNAQCSMPNAECSMPNPECPMPSPFSLQPSALQPFSPQPSAFGPQPSAFSLQP